MTRTTYYLLLFFAFLGNLCASEQKSPPLSQLNFSNGDQLSGSLLHMKQGNLEFHSPYFREKQLTFLSASILSLQLPSRQHLVATTPQQHIATLTLSDRIGSPQQYEKIKGRILNVSEKSVTLLTDFAGEIQVDNTLILSIKIQSQSKTIYQGPHASDAWHSLKPTRKWTLEDNQLISSRSDSSVAMDLLNADKLCLTFEVESESSAHFKALLYANTSKSSNPSHYYEFKVSNQNISLSRNIKNERHERLRTLRNPENPRSLFNLKKNTFSIYMDRQKGLFHVFINDNYHNSFIDHTPRPELKGSSLHFVDSRGQLLYFRKIHLTQWTAPAPIPRSANSQDALTGEGDTIHLANGDRIRGILGEVSAGAIAIKTPHATFQIPLSGITLLKNKASLNNQSKEDINDVKAYFHDGNWIIIDVEHIDSTHIHGNNEAFGDCQFDLSAFSKIEFNIYDDKLNALRRKRARK